MVEKNKHILDQAIQKLPTYPVPETIWSGIEQDLIIIDQDTLIEESIPFLPEYNPAETLWGAIETTLEKDNRVAKKIEFPFRRVLAYAAVLAGLSFAFFWLSTEKSASSFAYTEETVEESILANDWNSDEEGFEMVLAELEQSPVFFENPEIQDLKIELEELNMAKMEIEEMMEAYGKDEQIIAQIRDTELERTSIIKKLAAFLV